MSKQIEDAVAGLVNSAPEALNTLGELATAIETHEDAYDNLLATVGNKATKTELNNLKSELSESIVSENTELTIVDNDGNIVATINKDGLATTDLTLTGQAKIKGNVTIGEFGEDSELTVEGITRIKNDTYIEGELILSKLSDSNQLVVKSNTDKSKLVVNGKQVATEEHVADSLKATVTKVEQIGNGNSIKVTKGDGSTSTITTTYVDSPTSDDTTAQTLVNSSM